jgi:hypothetical protein
MNTRTRRWLLPLFAVVVGGYLLNLLVDRYYFRPKATEERMAAALEKRLSENRLQLRRLSNRLARRDELEERALPADLELAGSAYQSWLINLVSSLGLIGPNVDSTSPVIEEDITRLQFNIRGKANLKQLTRLLFDFYRAGSLHKVRQISLTPTGASDQLELQISVEALSLRRSRNEAGLATATSQRLAFNDMTEYAPIAKRNLFGEGTLSAAIRAARLTAVTSDRHGITEAWISLGADAQTLYLKAGDATQIDSIELVITEIGADSIKLEMDGQPGVVEVGQSLAEFNARR